MSGGKRKAGAAGLKSVDSLNAAAGPLAPAMGALDRLYKRHHLIESMELPITDREIKKWDSLEEEDRKQYLADAVRFCLLKHG